MDKIKVDEIKETRIYKWVDKWIIKSSEQINKSIIKPLRWVILSLFKWLFNFKLVQTLLFPLSSLYEEFFLVIWIVTTLFGGLFTLFADFLLGKSTAISETIETGNIYIFSITLLIPTVADCLLFFNAEEKSRKYKESKQSEYQSDEIEEKLVPILNIKTITKHVIVILALSLLVIVVSMFLYLGEYKSQETPQIVSAILSVYISFYYYCLNRVSQYKNNYGNNDYLEDEKKEMEKIKVEAKSKYSSETFEQNNTSIDRLKTNVSIRREMKPNEENINYEDEMSNVQTKAEDDWDDVMATLDKIEQSSLVEKSNDLE